MELFGTGRRIIAEVSTWDEVTVSPHPLGWTEFRYGRRAFGHLHGDHMVDILLDKALRVDLVFRGKAEPHPVLPQSGWVTVYLSQLSDELTSLKILRVAYDLARSQQPLDSRRFIT